MYDESAEQDEWQATIENREFKRVNDVADTEELLVRVISSDTQELHMVDDDSDITYDHMVGEDIVRVNGRQGGHGKGVRMVEEKEGGGPRGEPAIRGPEMLRGEHKSVKKRKGSGKDSGVVHGFDHGDR